MGQIELRGLSEMTSRKLLMFAVSIILSFPLIFLYVIHVLTGEFEVSTVRSLVSGLSAPFSILSLIILLYLSVASKIWERLFYVSIMFFIFCILFESARINLIKI